MGVPLWFEKRLEAIAFSSALSGVHGQAVFEVGLRFIRRDDGECRPEVGIEVAAADGGLCT